MKFNFIAAAICMATLSSVAKAECSNVTSGPSNLTILNVEPYIDGSTTVLLSNNQYYTTDPSSAGAKNQFNFLLVAWQMGISIDLNHVCTQPSGVAGATIYSVSSHN